MSEKACFQNILEITCENEAVNPLKSRTPGGYRRNESSLSKGINTPAVLFVIEIILIGRDIQWKNGNCKF